MIHRQIQQHSQLRKTFTTESDTYTVPGTETVTHTELGGTETYTITGTDLSIDGNTN